MRLGSRPILYLIALAILALVFGWLLWRWLVLGAATYGVVRYVLRRAGLRPRRRRRKATWAEWLEAIATARIAASFGGVTSKRERIPSGPLARYRLRSRKPGPSAQIAADSEAWDDPEFPFNV